ncbi:MAG: gamma subclass chorismate mutase AroQ [Candidatus Rhabdochlamydia sp.]
MPILFRFISQKMIYFLVFILCAQGVSTELQARYTPVYQSIEDFEIEQKVDQLLLLMQKRLVIMHEVARTKWNQNLTIEDKIREQQILADLAEKASKYGLDEKWTTAFFQAQMNASKEMQKKDFTLWQKEGLLKFEQVLSLKDELRFYIDQLNEEMMMLLSKIYKKGLSNRFILAHPISNRKSDYIEKDIWSLAIASFVEI